MKFFSLLATIMAISLTLVTADAEAARRFGAGKSAGMQRQTTVPDKSLAAPSTTKGQPAAAAAQTPPKRSWMGPLAGLAAGLGLAALASHFGFGEELASMLMIGVLIMVVMAVIGFVMRRRAGPQSAPAGAERLQYASASAESSFRGHTQEATLPLSGAGQPGAAPAATVGRIPAGFDVVSFERIAKVNFIRLQAANDAGNLDDIRAFTSPEMFAEIRMNIIERGNAAQETDVISLDASVIDVAEEASRYVVSVRFSGQIRENDEAAEMVDEIWHMTKPRDGTSGWILAGIQQTQ